MRRRRSTVLSSAIASCVALMLAIPATAGASSSDIRAPEPLTVAVIGDTPYGDEQLAAFPDLVTRINRDPHVKDVMHLGDIKNGSSECTDEYFGSIKGLFSHFLDPLVYTPGDNEWTDCHRVSNGGYDPLERLDTLRSVFFAQPGTSLGRRPQRLDSQADDPTHATFAENVRWVDAQTVFTMVHVVGSNNGLAPWFDGAETPEQTERRLTEVAARTAAALSWIDTTFDLAEERGLRGVVIGMQADTFIGGGNSGFSEIVRRLAERSDAFDGEVLLLQGDSHRYLVDQPLIDGHAGYGITTPVPNLTRIVVEGETTDEWLRLTVNPRADHIFTWTRER